MTRTAADPIGTMVLDCEALAQLIRRDPTIKPWLLAAAADDLRVVTSAATIVEATNPRLPLPAANYAFSRITVMPVTELIATTATQLLRDARLHGHKYAIDAMLCATAILSPGRATILTSDPEDIECLSNGDITVIKV